MDLGSVLRLKRKAKKLTLKTVADKAGISEGFLSQIENNVNSPSVDTLMNICASIGIEASEIIKQAENQERLSIIRKSDMADVDVPHSGFATRRFFPPETRRDIDSAVLVIEPGKGIPARKGVRNSQEVLCVLKGSLELMYEDQVISLAQNDSAHFWSLSDRQKITNRSKAQAVVLWVGTL